MKKFNTPFHKSIFICTQKRPDGHPVSCCANRGGMSLRQDLREMVKLQDRDMEIKVFTSGCLGACEHGPVAVRYPEGDYLLGITKDDLPDILDDLLAE